MSDVRLLCDNLVRAGDTLVQFTPKCSLVGSVHGILVMCAKANPNTASDDPYVRQGEIIPWDADAADVQWHAKHAENFFLNFVPSTF